jgi:hypothetical protein
MPPRMHKTAVVARIGLVFPLLVSPFPLRSQAEVPTRTDIAEAQSMELPDDPAAVLAVVGQTPILLGDLVDKAEARIKDVMSKTKQKIPEDQLHYARLNLVRGLLVEAVRNKMMRESFLLDQVGTAGADKHKEAEGMLSTRARQMFFESELPELKKQYKTENLAELDKKLREKGTSLAARQRDFTDAMLGHLYIRSKVEQDPNVSIAEIANYYAENSGEFAHPTRARWEQLTVLFSNFPTRDEAYQSIWEMGREAYFGGNLQAVAREKSQEPLASSGGLHEWTEKGALASDVLDGEIFSIELEAMSNIIEDEQGFHIIRVLERDEAGLIALSEVQDEVRATIRDQKIVQTRNEVMDKMQARVPVWSMYPDDIPGANPLPKVASRGARNLR